MKAIFLQIPLKAVSLAVGLVAILTFIYDIGFEDDEFFDRQIPRFYFILLNIFIFLNIIKFLAFPMVVSRRSQAGMIIFLIAVLLYIFFTVLNSEIGLHQMLVQSLPLLRFCTILFFAIEYSIVIERFYSAKFQPAFIFAISFIAIIIVGALLLKLPQATTNGITFVDALFTSTSAVCVTGLAVVDTSTAFTRVGQIIIMLLIQAGGLGVLTFTTFFAYFFKENISFRESLYVRDFISSDKLNDIFQLAVNIVALTVGIELIGAIMIYFWLPAEAMPIVSERIFFALFHAVSAFCNAGFSTLSLGLYEPVVQFNYSIHLIIAILIILGGIGYNIIFNTFDYGREKTMSLLNSVFIKNRNYRKRVRIVTLNTKIVIYTTLILLVFGTIFFFIAEYNNQLSDHKSLWGKLVTAFFGSVTPRTAGFNTVDYSKLHVATIMITILLMWIGASPASTGGGIKTSTFAIATLNIFSMARGKEKITIYKRVISDYSVRKTASIINLSLIMIGIGVFLVSSFEPAGRADFLKIAFECFSAFGTVGLSMGITYDLTDASKIVLIFLMFIGRVGAINLLIGLLRRMETSHLKYPEENILIN
ncbi:MAG: potassium transporter TrkG [Saprospiraceae bacterium]|nr:potassium transporter TrkG [Saprospiraceae bacterium]